MAKITDGLELEMKIRPYVPKSSASACLAIVNLYMNQHPEKRIKVITNNDGSWEYRIVEEES